MTRIVSISTTINDIPHLATTLWFSGCKLKCDGCHNTSLEYSRDGLSLNEVESILTKLRKMTDWLVYLGGNPLDSINDVLNISGIAKKMGFTQFLYSGYTFNEFNKMFDQNIHAKLLDKLDYIKTGRFDVNYSKKNCINDGVEYFFETLNQEVYKKNDMNWEKYYNFDFNKNIVNGNLNLI